MVEKDETKYAVSSEFDRNSRLIKVGRLVSGNLWVHAAFISRKTLV